MTPTQQLPDNLPFSPTERIESVHRGGPLGTDPEGSSGWRLLMIGLLLLSVTLVSAGIGFMVSGGRLPTGSPAPTPAAQTASQPTAQPTTTTPPAVQPTATALPKPTQPPATPTPAAPASKPTAAAATPGRDPRLLQIEGRIREYFSALNAEDYARAHQVCCTEAWRARYPLDRWERNFDGVTNLELVGEPRYRRVEPDIIEVDTDYTFVSGGRQRDFTLRWTFQPVGGEWQAELAEAFARYLSVVSHQVRRRCPPS